MTPVDEISCKELVELVTEYLDGALSITDRERFDAHLADCPWCVEYVAQIERTIAAVGASAAKLELAGSAGLDELLRAFRDWRAASA